MTNSENSTNGPSCQPDCSILVDELRRVFDCLPESRLAAKLAFDRWTGRSGYPIKTLLRAYLASYMLNMRNTNALMRRLQEDPVLREICGFDPEKPLPHRRTLNRFMDRLEKHQDLIEWCLDYMATKLHETLPGFGTIVAVDSTDIHSHSNPDRKAKSDPEAHFAAKGKGAKKWTWGYKMHLVADVIYELPIAFCITKGNVQDQQQLMPFLTEVRARLPWFSPKNVIADAGYDKYDNYEGIVRELSAEPIIKIKLAGIRVFGSSAAPSCIGGLPLVYRYWSKKKGRLYFQCPERAGRAACPLPEKCPLKAVWIHPVHDYRRFGYHIARNSEQWDNLYNRRVGIERIFSRLKEQRRLDSHCFRGFEKIRFHCALALLTLAGGALAKVKLGQATEVRSCARKIA